MNQRVQREADRDAAAAGREAHPEHGDVAAPLGEEPLGVLDLRRLPCGLLGLLLRAYA